MVFAPYDEKQWVKEVVPQMGFPGPAVSPSPEHVLEMQSRQAPLQTHWIRNPGTRSRQSGFPQALQVIPTLTQVWELMNYR